MFQRSHARVIASAAAVAGDEEAPAWLDRLFGSDDMHLLRKCPCPVWLMKPGETANYRCVAAAIDIDEGLRRTYDWYRSLKP